MEPSLIRITTRTNFSDTNTKLFQVSRVRLWRTPVTKVLEVNFILTFFWDTEGVPSAVHITFGFASLGETLNECLANEIHQHREIDQ